MKNRSFLSKVMEKISKDAYSPLPDLSTPTFFYEGDNWNGEPLLKPFFVIRTRGCSWKLNSGGCTMCGYGLESSGGMKVNEHLISSQLHMIFKFIEILRPKLVAITPVGSFFDDKEFAISFRRRLLEKLQNLNYLKVLQVESRPEYILRADMKGELDLIEQDFEEKKLLVGIGLETSNDFIREFCINKGFKRHVFMRACEILHEHDMLAKAYLLLKPPFLSEREALKDCLNSVSFAINHGADLIDVLLCKVYPHTLCSWLLKRKMYRVPWLWTALELLKNLHKDVMKKVSITTWGNPPYSEAPPYNCPRCSEKINSYLQLWRFSRTPQLLKEASEISCDCKQDWEKIINAELPSIHDMIEDHYEKLRKDLQL